MRRAKQISYIYVAGSIGFFAWDQWQSYSNGLVDDFSVVGNGIFISIILMIIGHELYRTGLRLRTLQLYVPIIFLVCVSWLFPYQIEEMKMSIWANLFERHPGWCPNHEQSNAGPYVCYHYTIEREFSGGGPQQWLVWDTTGVLLQSQDLWPDEIKRLFVGHEIQEIPKTLDCIFGDVKRIELNVYWVSNSCPGNGLR
jgi:hypothetical protein